MKKLTLLILLLPATFSMADGLSGYYLTPDWKEKDRIFFEENFKGYADEKKYAISTVYFNEDSKMYALYTERVFLKSPNVDLCSSVIEMRYISATLKPLNIGGYYLGSKHFLTNSHDSCIEQNTSEYKVKVIGFVDPLDVWYILSNHQILEDYLKSNKQTDPILQIQSIERLKEGGVEVLLQGKNGSRSKIIFIKNEKHLAPTKYYRIMD